MEDLEKEIDKTYREDNNVFIVEDFIIFFCRLPEEPSKGNLLTP